MEKAAQVRESNIVLALDLPVMEPESLLSEANRILESGSVTGKIVLMTPELLT